MGSLDLLHILLVLGKKKDLQKRYVFKLQCHQEIPVAKNLSQERKSVCTKLRSRFGF